MIFMKNKKIICADDDIDNRRYYARIIFKKYGLKIDEASNGQELVDEVQKNSYDLIITDYQMPFLDGLEAITEIRKLDGDIPIIMISGKQSIEASALEAGANAFYEKPVYDSKLCDGIEKLIGIN
jgi:CheY-like chemotaxis protein